MATDATTEREKDASTELEQIMPTRRPSTREELEHKRDEGVVAVGPSGAVYRLRQMNLSRHALAGDLPPTLMKIAMQGETAIQDMFKRWANTGDQGQDPELEIDAEQASDYLDRVVLASIMEPEFEKGDLGSPGKLDEDPLLPPHDYQWIVAVAFREVDEDAEGRRLWGVEPLSRFLLFRHFHGCDEDCAGCFGVQAALSSGSGG